MHRHSLAYIHVAVTVAVAVCASAVMLGSARAAGTPVDAPACALPHLAAPHVQQRDVERAALGIVQLRQYVWNTPDRIRARCHANRGLARAGLRGPDGLRRARKRERRSATTALKVARRGFELSSQEQ